MRVSRMHQPDRRGCGRAGFALLDVMMALTILALVAAVAMPGVSRPAGPMALRTAAYQLSALLHEARTTAIGTGRAVGAQVDRGGSGPRVTAGTLALDMPPGVTVALGDPHEPVLRFAPDGTSSGGVFLIRRDRIGVSVTVNADTGAIAVADP